MSFSLSGGAPLRIAAIVGAFVLLGVGYFVLGPGKPKTATTEHRLIRHPHGLQSFGRKAATTKKAAPAKTTVTPVAKAPTTAKHEATPVAKTKAKPKATPKSKPKPARIALVADLPYELAAALRQHSVVVVTIYNPHANDDQIAVAEASAGAALAGVGFVGVNVLDDDQIGPITRATGLIDSPSTLIYQRPGQVIGKLKGFADKETIAQAVQTAAPSVVKQVVRAAPPAAPAKTWKDLANAVCRRTQVTAQTDAALSDPSVIATVLTTTLAGLSKVDPPSSAAKAYGELLSTLKRMVADARAAAAAVKKGDLNALNTARTNFAIENQRGGAIAINLGLKSCHT